MSKLTRHALRRYNSLRVQIENLVRQIANAKRSREYWYFFADENLTQKKIDWEQTAVQTRKQIERCTQQIDILEMSLDAKVKQIVTIEPDYILPVIGVKFKPLHRCQ